MLLDVHFTFTSLFTALVWTAIMLDKLEVARRPNEIWQS